ncbi:DUF1648 domain-containing protein [Soonwooa sp.]|uniref:DUF1648 domain-containing protein n=1 Tax=Soonwooa sp. TaxID=1938592 RepID=UPI0028A95772|nr:DUF1648 domain-containing protein [Soonwooa sp.]
MIILLILINSLLLFGLLLFSALTYRSLPARIPTHFGFNGEADGFGNKLFYWLMPILGLIFFLIFSTQIADLKSLKISDVSSIRQNWNLDLKSSFGMLINTFVLIIFFEVQSSIYKVAMGQQTKMSKSVWIWTFLIIIFSVLTSTLTDS